MTIKVKATVAEAATKHPDGTVSILRAGINRVFGEEAPFFFEGCLVFSIHAEEADRGSHTLELKCLDGKSDAVVEQLAATMETPEAGGLTTVIFKFGLSFPQAGSHLFVISVDDAEVDRWCITAGPREDQECPS